MNELAGYPEKYKNSLVLCLEYLKKCNFSMEAGRLPWHMLLRFILKSVCLFLHFASLVAYIVKMISKGQNIFQNADLIPVTLIITQVFLKGSVLIMKKTEIKRVMDHLGAYWRFTDLTTTQLKKKKSTLKKLILGQKLLYNMCMLASFQYLLFPLLETLFRKFVLQQESELLLPFNSVYPFSVANWVNYLPVYAFQMYCIFLSIFMYMGPDMLLVTLCTHISNEFVLLQEDLSRIKPPTRKAVNEHNSAIEEDAMRDFVKRHQSVIRLTQELNAAFNKIIFINLLFAGLIICFFALAARASTGAAYMVNNLAVVTIILSDMLVFCYCSENLCVSSSGIADCAFSTLWYNADKSFKMTILLIIMRSQKPCSLLYMNYSAINLKTFTMVLSTTWSYFSLANTLYEGRD